MALSIEVFAPAKLNLYLHITERLKNGYHMLDSLVGFADIGDLITIEQAPQFEFEICGEFASVFSDKERDVSPASSNLAVRAAWGVARATGHRLDVKITLEKNLPFGAGLGGGSADAAAVIRALLRYWQMPENLPFMKDLLISLGADVPVCFHAKPAQIKGIGDIFSPLSLLPSMPLVIVHPQKPCATESVFKRFEGPYNSELKLLPFTNTDDFIEVLLRQNNVLEAAACEDVPQIANILQNLGAQKGVRIARMSGSGSACFAFFESKEEAKMAAKSISGDNPDWWVRAGNLLR
ncbi:MAG: 4-(cytidine 5'-diphospho)-2-C-methyl-D-erythritol kinase [Micavibrio sp.]|nr:4-(cytidine 5'-diphospho)-2-C-methyl-D-erythritol kinase [Micavibrio sp.]